MWHERAFNFFIWSPNLFPGLCPRRPYQVHPHWHWGAVLKSQDLGEVYHHNMAILKNLNECCLSLGMHRSCSENRHGRLASWENHYTLHPLANKERNISQHFPCGKKAALAKTDSERSWDDALSEKVQIAMMEFTKWDLGVTKLMYD